ncbi:MAG: hypothetical protein CfP315_0588 [Candidatus Improbicoccus pseudotrichonymphae]|uniref:Uncharacterized protein n=1 Tax=Candidatus Improbicoccus pseudotrichonymphae TaxID=3033792 RepID=A0AA48I8G4_9FIRM|nr:MAG: hypothetical protein CfP315_0588 [Candidatus Improbicoccus pseudotrichonymphae]
MLFYFLPLRVVCGSREKIGEAKKEEEGKFFINIYFLYSSPYDGRELYIAIRNQVSDLINFSKSKKILKNSGSTDIFTGNIKFFRKTFKIEAIKDEVEKLSPYSKSVYKLIVTKKGEIEISSKELEEILKHLNECEPGFRLTNLVLCNHGIRCI